MFRRFCPRWDGHARKACRRSCCVVRGCSLRHFDRLTSTTQCFAAPCSRDLSSSIPQSRLVILKFSPAPFIWPSLRFSLSPPPQPTPLPPRCLARTRRRCYRSPRPPLRQARRTALPCLTLAAIPSSRLTERTARLRNPRPIRANPLEVLRRPVLGLNSDRMLCTSRAYPSSWRQRPPHFRSPAIFRWTPSPSLSSFGHR